MTDGYYVKSSIIETANYQDIGKDYLSDLEIKVPLEASKNKMPKTKLPYLQFGFELV